MSNKVLDGSVLSSLGIGWMAQVDWVFWSGLLVGIGTIIARYLETIAKNRETDIKAQELELRERELKWDKEKHASTNSNKTSNSKAQANNNIE